MVHVCEPLLVVSVLGCVSASAAISSRVVCVEYTNEAESPTHFYGAIACALISALGFVTVPLRFCIRTETLWVHRKSLWIWREGIGNFQFSKRKTITNTHFKRTIN